MEQVINYEAIPGVALLNIPNLNDDDQGANLPNPSEHRTVLVSKKFVTGIEASVAKRMDNASVTPAPVEEKEGVVAQPAVEEAPTFSTPSIETPEVSAPSEEAPAETKWSLDDILSQVDNTPEEAPTVATEETPAEEEKTSDANDMAQLLESASKKMKKDVADVDNPFTDSMFFEVQDSLSSLSEMVIVLTQQRVEIAKQQEEMKNREEQINEREKKVSEKEKRVQEQKENNEKLRLENKKIAEENAKILTERTIALKAIATELENKEKINNSKFNELKEEAGRNAEYSKMLEIKANESNAKEAELNNLSDELKTRLSNLVDAENKFKALVTEFNETVNFNNTLNSISGKKEDNN